MTDRSSSNNKNRSKKNRGYILVAEDDKIYANIYLNRLFKEGFEVKIAENGKETIEAVRKRIPDLILLDMIMPVKDGFWVLKELKADPQLKNIKVIALSNLSFDEDAEKIKGIGLTEYIVKSNLSIDKLITKINSYF
ncbi:hypothetical protein A2Y99_04320 [Candidatus Gottesmanbacteria bacterium RBG_13_37_7]|uniref:Response regulatory domain-containing protein n=1 Tax=Candidatus Gottesmanbacteria bacterium RBG_13_37_7 TaxID=1798369 RepID=A0A1F5YHH0_9BACT|nr:MAG: hypothetical protein A2Y99_04320 [Candidatus Gottesmanbacteria bacterium RBG_13_37_7]